jgi:DNA replication protein DnaC
MNQIETQMNKLRLLGMVKSWTALQETRKLHELSLTDGMEILLQAEEQERNNRRFRRLEYQAGFRYKASMEELRTDPARGIDKTLIATLATGNYISKGESVLITGATGCGKSFLASALGHQACVHGFKVAYFNTQKLMLKTKMARLEGTIYKFFEKLSKTNLLILDDFGLTHFEKQQHWSILHTELKSVISIIPNLPRLYSSSFTSFNCNSILSSFSFSLLPFIGEQHT